MSPHHKGWPPFIPAALDDAGFTAQEFRVFCRIARSHPGKCFQKATTIANDCRLSENTVWNVLKRLESWGVISRNRRQGETTEFTINALSDWKIPSTKPTANETPTEAQTRRRVSHRKEDGGRRRKQDATDVPLLKVGKGTGAHEGEFTANFSKPGEFPDTIHIPVHRT